MIYWVTCLWIAGACVFFSATVCGAPDTSETTKNRAKQAFAKTDPEGFELPWWGDFVGKNPAVKELVEKRDDVPNVSKKESQKDKQERFQLPWWNGGGVVVQVEKGSQVKPKEAVRGRGKGNAHKETAEGRGTVAPAYERAVVGDLGPLGDLGPSLLMEVKLGLPRSHMRARVPFWEKRKLLGRRLLESILWTLEKRKKGEESIDSSLPYLVDRFEYEFLLNLVRTAKQFYSSVENERDKSYGTIGQFTAAYRHVLFPRPKNIWEDRLSASVFAYKLGINSPAFKHMRTGGWAFLEYNLHSYKDPTHRFLLLFAPLGVLKDHVSYKKARASAARWIVESAAGVEGLWEIGSVRPAVRALFIPRYDKVWAYRLHTEIAIRIRVNDLDPVTSSWCTEVVLVPKLLYIYTSDSLITDVATRRVLRKWPMPVWLDWLDFRKDLTAYLQVEFRLKS